MQPISRRTLLAFAATAGPAAFLAACGSSASTSKAAGAGGATTTGAGTAAPTTATSAAAVTTAAPAATTAAPATTAAAGKTTAAGKVTGTLNFLNFTDWAGPTTYADFASAFPGAKVNEIAWVSADDTISKARGRAGDIDVVLVDGTTFPRLTALGVLAELGSGVSLAPVAKQYKGNKWDPSDKFFAPTDHGRTGIVYRKDLVATPPKSWADFFAMAPQYSGKVAMLDYQGSVMDNVLVMLGKPVGSSDKGDLAAVLDVLKKVKPHLRAISTEVGKAVASGDAVMAMCDAYDAQLALTTNPNVAFVNPSEGQVGYLEGLAVLDGPRNDLARAFVNFFIESKNYAPFINKVASPYVEPDNAGIDDVLRKSPVINPPADVAAKVQYHIFLGEHQADFDAVWDAFKAA